MNRFPLASSAASVPQPPLEEKSLPQESSASLQPLAPPQTDKIVPDPFSSRVCSSPPMDRLAVNQLTTLRWNLKADLDEYASAGLPALGVSWRKLSEFGLQRGIRTIQKSGMPVSSLGWMGGFTGEYGHSLQDALQEGRRMIRAAGRLRAAAVTVICGPLGGHIRSHARRLVQGALQELGDLAALYDVELALQPMHRIFERNWSFLNTLDESLELLDQVGHPSVKLCFGTCHLSGEPDMLNRISGIAGRVALVTLSDLNGAPRGENDRLLPGEGTLPISETVRALEKGGYDGWYEIEVWSRDLWKTDHRDLLQRCLRSGEKLSAKLHLG